MSQNQANLNEKVEQKEEQVVNDHNMTSSIQPTHAEKKDPGIIQSHTNYTDQLAEQEKVAEETEEKQKIQSKENQQVLNTDKTVSKELDMETKLLIQDIFKPEPIKKQEASVQVGNSKNIQVLKNTEETYAPQSCQIHVGNENPLNQPNSGQNPINEGSENNKKSQVQIQVGVSLVDQPEKAINQAKQQRILSDHEKYSKFLQNQKLMSENQKSVYTHMYESIELKKSQILSWHDIFKDHFSRYASIVKDFSEKCEKVPKQEKTEQSNRYLNIGEELKDGFNQLVRFRETNGHNHRSMSEFIQGTTIKDLERAYSSYVNQMSNSLSLVNEKKKICLKAEDQLKKQTSKVQKMFSRTKQGKKQQDDFFVEISRVINLQQSYRKTLMEWGKQISTLRKSLITFTYSYCNQIQQTFNTFKNQSNTLYGSQRIKYEKIRNSNTEITEQAAFNKLIILVDSDYIRVSLQSSLKKQITEITEKQFDEFIEMPQAKLLLGEPRQLLISLVVKKFNLKDKSQELINTISGNLVLYDKDTLQCTQKMSVKNINTALTVEQGVIEIQEKVPGIIFDNKKKVKIEFQDSDRAEELVCFLGQGQANNN